MGRESSARLLGGTQWLALDDSTRAAMTKAGKRCIYEHGTWYIEASFVDRRGYLCGSAAWGYPHMASS